MTFQNNSIDFVLISQSPGDFPILLFSNAFRKHTHELKKKGAQKHKKKEFNIYKHDIRIIMQLNLT